MKTYTSHSLETIKPVNNSHRYWISQARKILTRNPLAVVIVVNSRTEAIERGEISRGANRPIRPNAHIIIPSTGGKWGRSREDIVATSLAA